MAEVTKIQWTGHTFNPFRGCQKVSEGCKFCYAERLSVRNPKVLGVWGPQGTRVLASDAQWKEPEKWNRHPQDTLNGNLVFCASLADIFEDWDGQMTNSKGEPLWVNTTNHAVPTKAFVFKNSLPLPQDAPHIRPYSLNDARKRLWSLIRRTPNLTWQLLTKRPENIPRMMPAGEWGNVWLGNSVETQEYTWRLDALQEAREKVRVPVLFCSAEPLLGPLDISPTLGGDGINWVIVGGESGGDGREMQVEWVRNLLSQCKEKEVPCFVKQMGKVAVVESREWEGRRYQLALAHDTKHGGDPRDWPTDLRVREFP